ncbi:glycoside hydrolase family 88 protein [Mucilaginibacter sp. BT774]|uniref:glycoside hydrolase family 88 protein n=1 Tax=Mucilaginibacter sp. BT774 TaxID=3062276 RepID=UPI00267635CE|nr:glycoside hydrolase family 88 protein [Mucilaginibacter sp. BT774]MDO3628364.1 glycoside hydrolase family 88 protein [Mucilaginibacter sp. BT774]
MRKLVTADLEFSVQQYKSLIHILPPGEMLKTYDAATGKLITSDSEWWCSGFYPGTLWYLYEYSGDTALKREAEKRMTIIKGEAFNSGNHDLGFKIFCSFGNAYRITKQQQYKETILTAAKSLASRYRPTIKSIQSWDSSAMYKCPVIIDNLMNLELLEWSSKNGGESRLGEIAVNHANTTMKNHFRPDFSSYHLIDYDLSTGKVMRKITRQGAADSSAWSRGQAWGLYGYTMMYRFTKNRRYLSQAKHIAKFILNHPHLPADKIPYWDFDAPGIPNTYRDASAAAVMASAFLELGRYTKGQLRIQYIATAEKIIQTLSSPLYLAKLGTNGGFLLKHSVGALPFRSEVDVPLTYADYYFVEALIRYKNWYLKGTRKV